MKPRREECLLAAEILCTYSRHRHSHFIPHECWPLLTKRDYYYLDKWTNKGWWDYGVSARGRGSHGRGHFGGGGYIASPYKNTCVTSGQSRCIPVSISHENLAHADHGRPLPLPG
jgi:hypothetical protein